MKTFLNCAHEIGLISFGMMLVEAIVNGLYPILCVGMVLAITDAILAKIAIHKIIETSPVEIDEEETYESNI